MYQVASTRSCLLLSALLSLPAFGCSSSDDSGNDNTGGTAPMMPTGGGGGAGPGNALMLADCELASSADPNVHDGYKAVPENGWEIAWFTYTDAADAMTAGTAIGTITPMEKAPFVCVQDTRNGAPTYVFNAKGSGFTAWGAGMGFNMQIMAEPTPPGNVNLSAYTGVKFWAKVNAATTGVVRLKVVDAQTTPIARGGTCTGANGKCDNTFGQPLSTISTEWQQFTVPFAMMKQETWASEMFTAVQTTNVIGFQFQVGKTTFDYSVDDFELY
jgi:hypothetical protein